MVYYFAKKLAKSHYDTFYNYTTLFQFCQVADLYFFCIFLSLERLIKNGENWGEVFGRMEA